MYMKKKIATESQEFFFFAEYKLLNRFLIQNNRKKNYVMIVICLINLNQMKMFVEEIHSSWSYVN